MDEWKAAGSAGPWLLVAAFLNIPAPNFSRDMAGVVGWLRLAVVAVVVALVVCLRCRCVVVVVVSKNLNMLNLTEKGLNYWEQEREFKKLQQQFWERGAWNEKKDNLSVIKFSD